MTAARIKKYGLREDRLWITKKGESIRLTYGQVEQLRLSVKVCEICNLPEKADTRTKDNKKGPIKLAVDYDHASLKFRGFLCRSCNYKLG